MRYYEMIFILHPNIPEEELSVITGKVTGVIEDQPTNSHLKYDALISSTTVENEFGGGNEGAIG